MQLEKLEATAQRGSTSDLYPIISMLTEKGVAFKVTDDPAIDPERIVQNKEIEEPQPLTSCGR